MAVKATLYRAGFLTRAEFDWDFHRGPTPDSSPFREFGFVDKGTEERKLGDGRPNVVIVCEKDSLADKVRVLSEQFGVSYIVGWAAFLDWNGVFRRDDPLGRSADDHRLRRL